MKTRRTLPLGLLMLPLSVGCASGPRPSGAAAEPYGVQGWVAPGYEAVREAFASNLARRGELGGAFAARVDGELVVDLWGGRKRPGRGRAEPWERDTLVNVFSATKGLAAVVLAHLHSRGLLDYDAPVARYWPGFSAHGKEDVTVRQLLSHQAGLLFPPRPIDPDDLASMAEILADTRPEWTPGDHCGYHAGTIGYCIQVIASSIDPSGRTVGAYLREEIMEALGEEFYIGLPDDVPDERIATLKPFSPLEAIFHLSEIPKGLRAVLFNPRSLFWRSMGDAGGDINDRGALARENPSGFGVGTARAMAAVYGDLASGGRRLGLDQATLELLFAEPERPRLGDLDLVMNLEGAAYGLGFQKSDGTGWFSKDPGAIGFLGASGAFGWADSSAGIGAAYVTNRMSPGTQIDDPRERALREALYACAAKSRRPR